MTIRHALLALGALFLTGAAPASTPPTFTAPNITVAENAGPARLTINKSAKAKSYSQLRVETVDGSGKAGVDYAAVNTVVTFGNNTLSTVVPIPVIDNSLYQTSRIFGVRITPLRNAVLASGYEAVTVTIAENDTPPAPPATGLEGAPTIPDNFDVSAWLIPGEPPHASPDEVGAFRFTCLPGQLLYDDPMVYPGQPRRSHLHQFWSNDAGNAYSTYETLRTTGGSTCTRSTGVSPQRSLYWAPAMLDGAGNAVKPDWINTYYKRLPASDPNCLKTTDPAVPGRCVDFPNSLRFILGFNMANMTGGPADLNSRDHWAMGYDCVKTDGTGESYTGIAPTITAIVATGKCPTGAWLRVYLTFPSCWNGKDLDSADHRAHIAFAPQMLCEPTHPYRIPEIAIQALYTTDANFAAGKWLLASDAAMAEQMGAPVVPGTTLHMDYWEAWSPTIKALWQAHCINEHLSCSTGNVGDGRQVKGMQAAWPIAVQPKVPLSSIP